MGIEGWIERHCRAWRRLGQGRLDSHSRLGHRSSPSSRAVFWMLRLLKNHYTHFDRSRAPKLTVGELRHQGSFLNGGQNLGLSC